MTQELRDPLEPVRWRRPLFATLGGLAVVLALSLGIPAVLHARAGADTTVVAALVDGFAVPGAVEEPCTQGAERCWTTDTGSAAVTASAEAEMRAAGVAILDASCVVAVHTGLDESCSVAGTLRGRAVSLSAFPRLAPGPPVRQVAVEVQLWAAVAD